MAKTTLTQAQALISAISILNGETSTVPTADIIEKLTAMHTTITNKSHSKVNAATVAKRTALAETVLSTLATAERPVTVSELQRMNPELATAENGEIISGQRISYTLRTLVESGKVVNTKDKKKSLFALADTQ